MRPPMDDLPDLELIAARLKKAREHVRPRMNQEAAAKAIGVSVSTLQKWEQGVNSPPSINLAALARLYGCTADYLCGLSVDIIDAEDRILLDKGLLAQLREAIAAGDQQAAEDLMLWEPPPVLGWIKIPRQAELVTDVEAQRERRRIVFELEEAFPDLVMRWRRRFFST